MSKLALLFIKYKMLVLILAILAALFSFGALYMDDDKKPIFDFGVDSNAVSGGTESRSQEEIVAELNKKVADSMINISMNTAPTFENGNAEGNLMIVNQPINNYLQVVEIYKDDTKELIYKSGGIPVGSKIEKAKLKVSLKQGTYDCTAYFSAVNEKTKEVIGKAGAKIKISVLN